MDLAYRLSGTFIEACNCAVICPCWVDDEPDEAFCAGLFAWTFEPASRIEGHDVSGLTLVSVTVHGDARRGGDSQSALYLDHTADAAVRDLLVTAFAGRGGGALAALARVTGDVVDSGPARIAVTGAADPDSSGGWEVSVRLDDATTLIKAAGMPAAFDGSTRPLQLTHTALSAEHGIGDGPVTAQRTDSFVVDVSPLPGPGLDLVGRSGMRGRFSYIGAGPGTGGRDRGGPDDR